MIPGFSCISFTFHLPMQNQEGRETETRVHQDHFVSLHQQHQQKLLKNRTARERKGGTKREKERESTEYNRLTRNSDRLCTNCDCPCFMFLGGYNIATVKMQCKEVASRSSRELRLDRDACRVDEFLEMALEELGSSICGSLEKHKSEQARKRMSI